MCNAALGALEGVTNVWGAEMSHVWNSSLIPYVCQRPSPGMQISQSTRARSSCWAEVKAQDAVLFSTLSWPWNMWIHDPQALLQDLVDQHLRDNKEHAAMQEVMGGTFA